MNEQRPKEYDIIILGGGLVGLTTAAKLGKIGYRVALVERKAPPLEWDLSEYDLRCSAINLASEQIFRDIGIWGNICQQRLEPYQHMFVWDGQNGEEINFTAQSVAQPNLGHIIENRVMVKALWEHCQQQDNIQLITGYQAVGLQRTPDHVQIDLNNEKQETITVQAKLLVGADGARSLVRDWCQLPTGGWDYQHSALVATIKTSKAHQHTAWQIFNPGGPLAFLPLPDPYHCTIVWSTRPDRVNNLLNISEQLFNDELARSFQHRLGEVQVVSPRRQFPLQLRYAKKTISDRVVLVGDAAHAIHPLAGQGVNLGLQDVLALSELLAKQPKIVDIGSHLVLRQHERARKAPVMKMIAAIEFFKRCFASEEPLFSKIRQLGIRATNRVAWLKRQCIKEAMGLGL